MTYKMQILILDDDLTRHAIFNEKLKNHDVTGVYHAKDCIRELKEHTWDVVFLDHDLGGYQMVDSGIGTGWEVADWLNKNPDRKPEQVLIHSLNPPGAEQMRQLIEGSQCTPGIWTTLERYID